MLIIQVPTVTKRTHHNVPVSRLDGSMRQVATTTNYHYVTVVIVYLNLRQATLETVHRVSLARENVLTLFIRHETERLGRQVFGLGRL